VLCVRRRNHTTWFSSSVVSSRLASRCLRILVRISHRNIIRCCSVTGDGTEIFIKSTIRPVIHIGTGVKLYAATLGISKLLTWCRVGHGGGPLPVLHTVDQIIKVAAYQYWYYQGVIVQPRYGRMLVLLYYIYVIIYLCILFKLAAAFIATLATGPQDSASRGLYTSGSGWVAAGDFKFLSFATICDMWSSRPFAFFVNVVFGILPLFAVHSAIWSTRLDRLQ